MLPRVSRRHLVFRVLVRSLRLIRSLILLRGLLRDLLTPSVGDVLVRMMFLFVSGSPELVSLVGRQDIKRQSVGTRF